VGSGATAEVFKGFWDGKTVAIKQIFMQRKEGKLKQEVSFTREVAVMSRINHPNLVRFYGVCLAEKPLCVITEFCEGQTCFELLHRDEDVELVWKQQHKMCLDIASAMSYLHSFKPQIIHRDLKSLNLLLAKKINGPKEEPIVKVSDFGMARMKDLDAEWDKMTKAAGTCHWMAPEVLTGVYDEKADVYSYSMCLFEIICREIPFEEEEGAEVMNLISEGARPDLEAVPPDCPGDLRELMIRCWSHKPENRPAFSKICDTIERIAIGDGRWAKGWTSEGKSSRS